MTLLIIVLGAFLLLLFIAFFFQEKMIFFPQKLLDSYQYEFDQPFEERWFEPEQGVKLNALHFKADNSKGLILYFHGNAGSLGGWGSVAEYLVPLGYDLLIMDYRGYGKSKGKIANEKNLHNDAEYIYKAMLKEYKEENIVLYGRSLGTGIAAKLATENNPKVLILESPYYSFPDVAKAHYPFLPIDALIKYKLPNHQYLQKVSCKAHIIHGTDDKIIPYNAAERLRKVSNNIMLHTIHNGGHNDLSQFDEYHSTLKQILE